MFGMRSRFGFETARFLSLLVTGRCQRWLEHFCYYCILHQVTSPGCSQQKQSNFQQYHSPTLLSQAQIVLGMTTLAVPDGSPITSSSIRRRSIHQMLSTWCTHATIMNAGLVSLLIVLRCWSYLLLLLLLGVSLSAPRADTVSPSGLKRSFASNKSEKPHEHLFAATRTKLDGQKPSETDDQSFVDAAGCLLLELLHDSGYPT